MKLRAITFGCKLVIFTYTGVAVNHATSLLLAQSSKHVAILALISQFQHLIAIIGGLTNKLTINWHTLVANLRQSSVNACIIRSKVHHSQCAKNNGFFVFYRNRFTPASCIEFQYAT